MMKVFSVFIISVYVIYNLIRFDSNVSVALSSVVNVVAAPKYLYYYFLEQAQH